MVHCDCCGKKVDEKSIQWVFGYSVCIECLNYYGEEEVIEKIESGETEKDLPKNDDQFSDIKNAIRSGKTVYWKNENYPCHVSPGNELCIVHIGTGNMQWAGNSYNVSDFKVVE